MYKALLFHPEGDYVTDCRDSNSVQDVWNQVANFGSRWIFYPITFVTTDKTIIDTPEGLEFLKGKRITSVQKFLSENWKDNAANICDVVNEGGPYWAIYIPESYKYYINRN